MCCSLTLLFFSFSLFHTQTHSHKHILSLALWFLFVWLKFATSSKNDRVAQCEPTHTLTDTFSLKTWKFDLPSAHKNTNTHTFPNILSPSLHFFGCFRFEFATWKWQLDRVPRLEWSFNYIENRIEGFFGGKIPPTSYENDIHSWLADTHFILINISSNLAIIIWTFGVDKTRFMRDKFHLFFCHSQLLHHTTHQFYKLFSHFQEQCDSISLLFTVRKMLQ